VRLGDASTIVTPAGGTATAATATSVTPIAVPTPRTSAEVTRFEEHVRTFRGYELGVFGSLTVGNNSWSRGTAALFISSGHLTRPGTGTQNIVLNLENANANGWQTLSHAEGLQEHTGFHYVPANTVPWWIPSITVGADRTAQMAAASLPRIMFGGIAIHTTTGVMQTMFPGEDLPAGYTWLAIPYIVHRPAASALEIVYRVEDARNSRDGEGFLFMPLFFQTGANVGSEYIVFSALSQVLAGRRLPVTVAGLGNVVTLGAAQAAHPVNAPIRNITISEQAVGALINAAGVPAGSATVATAASTGGHGIFRVAIPMDNAFQNQQNFQFTWWGVSWATGQNAPANNNGFRSAGARTPDGDSQVFPNVWQALALPNGFPVSTAMPAWIGGTPAEFNDRLARGDVSINEIAWAFNHTTTATRDTHTAFLTQPTFTTDTPELIIVMGTQAGTRVPGVLARLEIQHVATRASVTHRNHQFPAWGVVEARISGQGLTAGDHPIATLSEAGMILTGAPSQAAVTELVAGRFYGHTPGTNIPVPAGSPANPDVAPTAMTWLPAAGTLSRTTASLTGTPANGNVRMLGETGRIRLHEVVPMSAPGFTEFTFTLTDAYGNVLPEAKIGAVHINTNPWGGGATAGGATVNNGIHGAWQNRVGTQQPVVTSRHNGTNIWAAEGSNSIIGATGVSSAVGGDPLRGVAPGGSPGLSGNAMLSFSEDGHSVSVSGVSVDNPGVEILAIDVRFWISTDPGFTGDVYVTVTTPRTAFTGFHGEVEIEGNTRRIAEVRQVIEVAAVPTPVHIGFGRVPVGNITVTELEHGALRQNARLTLALTEHVEVASWASGINFWPVPAGNVHVIDGHSNVNFRPILAPVTGTLGGQITLNVTRPSRDDGGVIQVRGLETRVDWTVPFVDIALVARGDAVLNNDHFVMNAVGNIEGAAIGAGGAGGAGGRMLSPGETGFRRYGFTGLVVPNYLAVVTPGAGGTIDVHSEARIFWDGGGYVEVDGIRMPLLDENGNRVEIINVGGRTMIPMRAVSSLLGGSIGWVDSARGPGVHLVYVTIGARTVSFWRGVDYHVVHGTDGVGRPNVSGESVPVYFRDGTHFVPIRGLINAFGFEYVDDHATSSTVINPRR
jgi:hypothetical protein